eukprot:6490447-Amphidinium_carterae.3
MPLPSTTHDHQQPSSINHITVLFTSSYTANWTHHHFTLTQQTPPPRITTRSTSHTTIDNLIE